MITQTLLVLAMASQSVVSSTSQDDAVFVSEVRVRAPKLSAAEVRVANRYARCMAFPYFVVAAEFAQRQRECRHKFAPRKARKMPFSVLKQIDTIVRNDPGSEASLNVVRGK
ncbi:MAG: hypothetical protein ABL881_03030 [Novosphingobium sp.]